MKYDLVVIGGGPAGLSAAYEAYKDGVKNILIIERDKELGGILNQCIHNGFGLHKFKQELTGPEYAQRYIDLVASSNINVYLDTMVMQIFNNKTIHVISHNRGYEIIETKTIILSMGCRERTRGAIAIPGDRPAGILTAGAAQRYINIEGKRVGNNVIILGSGDIGLIMARRMSLEGYKVAAVIELMPYSNGLTRNLVQCLDDYNIPLYLGHTITHIQGENRLEKVIVAKVDENRKPISGTEIEFNVDTLLLSVGLIPENELSKGVGTAIDTRTNGLIVTEQMETSIPGIFACGNAVHVHDLVDFVSEEGELAGLAASKYIKGELIRNSYIEVKNGEGVSYTVPQKISEGFGATISFRVRKVYKDIDIVVESEGTIIASFKREHSVPAEMEKIKLDKDLLSKAKNTLQVKIVER